MRDAPHSLHVGVFVFFFQAEDGIRDLYVTGVQTCALPISSRLQQLLPAGGDMSVDLNRVIEQVSKEKGIDKSIVVNAVEEIGRASCRERVWIAGAAVA